MKKKILDAALVGILTASDFIRLSLELMDALEASERLECAAAEA